MKKLTVQQMAKIIARRMAQDQWDVAHRWTMRYAWREVSKQFWDKAEALGLPTRTVTMSYGIHGRPMTTYEVWTDASGLYWFLQKKGSDK
jgi:hypothetical protein